MGAKGSFIGLCAGVVVLLAAIDFTVFPGGIPRDLPWLGWEASGDKYIYAITPREPLPAEVFTICLLGSSLVQKGAHAATMEELLTVELQRPCRVFNYGIGGAYMCDILLALHRALAMDPDMVIVGTSWRDYPDDAGIDPRETAAYELLFDVGYDVPDYMRLTGAERRVDYGLKQVWSLFRYRHWIKMNMGALANAVADPGREKNPILFQHRGQVDWAAAARRIAAVYGTVEREYPNRQSLCLERAVDVGALSRAQLSLVSMPRSRLWFSMDPDTQQVDSEKLLRSAAVRGGAGYLNASRLCGDEYFIDSRHLNQEGAVHFSRWLAREIADSVRGEGLVSDVLE
jgi:hypothetical protein